MSCITVSHSPIGGIWCSTGIVGWIDVNVYPFGGIVASGYPLGGIHVTATQNKGIYCRMWQECSTNIGKQKYLEIEPTIVWVLNGWTSNDVYSNTTWNVD